MIRFLMVFLLGAAMAAPAAAANPRVRFETSKGAFVVELEQAKAPVTVGNFLEYVRSGFFDGTIFHRVIPGFMVQGGGFTADMQQKPAREPIVNESANGLANQRGTIAMARTADPNSASSQFFINLVDNGGLDKAQAKDGVGYCVFGVVVQGMSVVDAIAAVKTGAHDVPLQPVVVKKATVVTAAAAAQAPAVEESTPPQPQ